MKRFYDRAAVVAQDNGFVIALDDRVVKTPEKRPAVSPTIAMAEAICQEWNDQGDKVKPDDMPLTKLQNTAIDRVATRRDDLIAELVKYAGTDLLCYRAGSPEDLCREQTRIWQPLLDWVSQNHGLTLTVTTGILPVAQDVAQLGTILQEIDSFRLAAFYNITTLCGSVSVALNVLGGNITADQAWAAACLDENYQTAQWGTDDEAKTRHDNMKSELDAAVRFLALTLGSA